MWPRSTLAMKFSALALCLFLSILGVHLEGVEAQSKPCTLPTSKPGICVAIQRCRNIYSVVRNPNPETRKYDSYIAKAACSLPGVVRSICCSPQEVVRERSTTTPRATISNRQDMLPKYCGRKSTDRISHGNLTQVFAYPWMAILRYNENGLVEDKCGGSLIHERYVLTAAHCIKTKSAVQLQSVILGEHTKNQDPDCNVKYNVNGEELERDCADPAEEFGIEWAKIHEEYNRPKYSNDIGIIRLDRDVVMKDHIQPICLPITEELQNQKFKTYTVTGWGTTENNAGSNVLQEANLRHVEIESCQRTMTNFRMVIRLSDKQLCAQGNDLVDACRGDSGGPLISSASYVFGSARYIQLGIVTSGIDSCGHKSAPGIYCRVASYVDWILDRMECSV